jgi:hypothetical protein
VSVGSTEPGTLPEGSASRRPRSAEVVAGYLSALAIFASAIALAWHPLRLSPPAMLLALIASGMAPRNNRLAFAGVAIAAACFFLGLTIAVVTERPLW